MDGTIAAKLDNLSKARMPFARSGVIALGKKESGHPSQSDASLIALLSAGRERSVDG